MDLLKFINFEKAALRLKVKVERMNKIEVILFKIFQGLCRGLLTIKEFTKLTVLSIQSDSIKTV